ncbi:MAG: hypothetical protein ACFE7E_04455 [Candidatus Hodarchaeota archaeon]
MGQHNNSNLQEEITSELKSLKSMIKSIFDQLEALQKTISENFQAFQNMLATSSKEPRTPMHEIFSASSDQLSDRYSELSWALRRTLEAVKEAYDVNSAGITARKLANEIEVSRSRASELLNELVTKGYLEKYQEERFIKFRPKK